jgi:hypothetical protein
MKPNAYQLLRNKTKKIVRQLNKSIKNKFHLQKCESFCKNDYLIEMDKVYKNNAKKWKVPYNPTKKDREFSYNVCKKTFCNTKCEGYPKKLNRFSKSYSKNKIKVLQEKGAMSGCVDIIDYNVFH